MNKTEIYRSDFDTSIMSRMDEVTLEETRILEDYAEQIGDLSKLALGWSEDYTDVVNMEDELANIKATFVDIEGYKTLLGGTPITFTKVGKTYKPMLSGIEIKGGLKHKLVAHLTKAIEPKIVNISGTPAVKYTIQYGTYGLEIYVFKNGNSFFKAFMSAKQDRKKKTIIRPKTYSHEEADKINGGAFPEIELDMLERALDLVDELENLCYKSDTIARAVSKRTDTNIYKIKELEARIIELEEEAH